MTQFRAQELARRIDISCVRAQNSENDVRLLAAEAKHWHCINAHVLPNWLPLLRELLEGSDTFAASPVVFSAGGVTTETKIFEAEQLVQIGVQELDVVLNIGRLIDGDLAYVKNELRSIIGAVPPSIPVKAIIEVSHLNEEQIRIATRLVAESGSAFVKTGTGWAGPVSAAAIEIIARELEICGGQHVQIKAAGGIRTPQDVEQLASVGATRFGIGLTAAVEILNAVSQE